MIDDSPLTVSSMVAPLRRVLMRRPTAILDADPGRWHYAAPIDGAALSAQFDRFADLVSAHGAAIDWLPDDVDDLADSVFTYDPSFVLGEGAVILSPGKILRRPEADLHLRFYDANDVLVLGRIELPGTVEGGDLCWLDSTTLAAGRGFRTNQAGIDQLSDLAASVGVDVVAFDLPYGGGPDACLHLLSLVNPLDDDLALVYEPMVPVALVGLMEEMGYDLLAVPDDEFADSAGLCLNVLATAPRVGIAIAGFDQTLKLMTDAGCTIDTFEADALCLPCEGGPTCLTRPLVRSAGEPS